MRKGLRLEHKCALSVEIPTTLVLDARWDDVPGLFDQLGAEAAITLDTVEVSSVRFC